MTPFILGTMSFESLTNKHLFQLKATLQNEMASKNIDNTGNASQSLEVSGNQLLGNEYIYYLDKGRGAGKFPPVQNIRDWVRQKLNVEEKQINSVSFLIGRKISTQGTGIFRNNAKGIQLDLHVENMIDELFKELPDEAAAEALKWL